MLSILYKYYFIFLLLVALSSKSLALDEVKFSENDAIKALYGGYTFDDKILRDSEKRWRSHEEHLAHVKVLLFKKIAQNETELAFIVTSLTPRPREEQDCHGCYQLINIAVFEKINGLWELISSTPKPIIYGMWGINISLQKLGNNFYGILIHTGDVFQGYQVQGNTLYIPQGKEVVSILENGFPESPGPGVCARAKQPIALLEIIVDESQAYYPIKSTVRYNTGSCRTKIIESSTTSIYRYDGNKYVPQNP